MPTSSPRRWHSTLYASARGLTASPIPYGTRTFDVSFDFIDHNLTIQTSDGRRAPERLGADRVTREAYSHEVSSAGLWPGGGQVPEPVFYAYATPEPAGFKEATIRPPAARYSADLREYLLRYEDARSAPDPDTLLLAFLQSTYEAATELAGWDRAALER